MPLTMNDAFELAKAYHKKWMGGTINLETMEYVEGTYKLDGPAWLVNVEYPPSNFDCLDHATIVVSIKSGTVAHFINQYGNIAHFE
jgi:hypothetical protein